MKIGIIADIHNNVIALEAILQEFARQNVEKVICAGDIIGIGPYPEETVQKMMTIPNLLAVRGNHEGYLLAGLPKRFPNVENMSYEEREYHRWEHQCLSSSSIAFLQKLPYQIEFNELGKKLVIMHYGMDQNHQFVHIVDGINEKELGKIFPQHDQDIVIYGHDHSRMIAQAQTKWFINAGSLGCPAIEQNIARAAILEIAENGQIIINVLDVRYDVAKVIKKIDQLRYPTYKEVKKIFFGSA